MIRKTNKNYRTTNFEALWMRAAGDDVAESKSDQWWLMFRVNPKQREAPWPIGVRVCNSKRDWISIFFVAFVSRASFVLRFSRRYTWLWGLHCLFLVALGYMDVVQGLGAYFNIACAIFLVWMRYSTEYRCCTSIWYAGLASSSTANPEVGPPVFRNPHCASYLNDRF